MKNKSIFEELIKKGCNADISQRFEIFSYHAINGKNTLKTFKTLDDGINYFNKMAKYYKSDGWCWDTIISNRGTQYFIILCPR